jgi:beta-lactam-binding protein with PASTA domain
VRSIFISYRRDDAEGEAGRLFDDLVVEFGEQSVFMDVSTIEAGRDFRKVIDESVSTCGVLLALIGITWIDTKNETGQRRLDDPADFVRLETASALRRDIPVIPVLLRGTKMPRAEKLPNDLKDLAYRNGVELTHARWNSDVQLLIKSLHQLLDSPRRSAGEIQQTATGSGMTATGARTASEPKRIEPLRTPVPTPPDNDRRRRRWRKPVVIAVGVLLIAIVGVCFLVPRRMTVPDVRGTTVAAAMARLQGAQLAIGSQTYQLDPTKEPNTVIAQTPTPDARVSRGTKVDLVLSPLPVIVPDLIGKSFNAAEKSLRDDQLRVGAIDKEARDGVERNTVLAEFPRPGDRARAGSEVDLRVADGSPATNQPSQAELITVPSLLNESVKQAEFALHDAGLTVGNVTSEERADLPRGTVIQQAPKPGSKVRAGTRVYLTASEEPAVKMVAVPLLLNKSYNDASALLQNQGLTIGTVKRSPSHGKSDVVLDQFPSYGQQVATGSKIDLTVSTSAPEARWVGRWINSSPYAQSITIGKLDISTDAPGQSWSVHAWGTCARGPRCDWGVGNAKVVRDRLVVIWKQGNEDLRIAIQQDGEQLLVNSETVNTDRRTRLTRLDYLARQR